MTSGSLSLSLSLSLLHPSSVPSLVPLFSSLFITHVASSFADHTVWILPAFLVEYLYRHVLSQCLCTFVPSNNFLYGVAWCLRLCHEPNVWMGSSCIGAFIVGALDALNWIASTRDYSR